jgi:DNA-binding MarR family transcriptional regulator
MSNRGLVVRQADSDNPRAMYAVLTDDGLAAIKGAAPGHGRDVQSLFFDHLTERQVAQLSAISRRVLEGLLPEDLL